MKTAIIMLWLLWSIWAVGLLWNTWTKNHDNQIQSHNTPATNNQSDDIDITNHYLNGVFMTGAASSSGTH